MQLLDMTLDLIAPVNSKQYQQELEQIKQAESQAMADLIEESHKWDSNPQQLETELLCKSIL